MNLWVFQARVAHAQRAEAVLRHEAPVGQATELFDDGAQHHVVAVAVAKTLARYKGQRLALEVRQQGGRIGHGFALRAK